MDRRTKKVSLDFMGEGWTDCFVELYYLRYEESKAIAAADSSVTADDPTAWINLMIERVQDLFVSGQVLADGKPVDLTKDAIAGFDVDALVKLNNAALGLLDPKDSPSS